jgi:hypothetical protein
MNVSLSFSFLYVSNSMEQCSLTGKTRHQQCCKNLKSWLYSLCIPIISLSSGPCLLHFTSLWILVNNQNPSSSCYEHQHVYFDHLNTNPLCRTIIIFGLWYFTATKLVM